MVGCTIFVKSIVVLGISGLRPCIEGAENPFFFFLMRLCGFLPATSIFLLSLYVIILSLADINHGGKERETERERGREYRKQEEAKKRPRREEDLSWK